MIMLRRRVSWAALCAAMVLLVAVGVRADFVTIGNPHNDAASADNTSHGLSGAYGYGAVPYTYQISRTAVSIAEWDLFYGDGTSIGGGTAVGSFNANYNYWDDGTRMVGSNAPAVRISFNQAAQYVNWLTTGDATEGAYTIDGTTGYVTGIMSREEILATGDLYYLIPTEDEWYKAAYYEPDDSGYSLYAHGPDTVLSQSTDGSNNWNYDSALSSASYVWTVDSGTEEQNGTLNMMGNVWEWNEGLSDSLRGLLGGSYSTNESALLASSQMYRTPSIEDVDSGFRVASIPEPASVTMLLAGAVGLLLWRSLSWRTRC